MRKRLLALLLTVTMLIGVAPVAGNAAETTPGEVTEGGWEILPAGGLLPLVVEEIAVEGEPACGSAESTGVRAESDWDKYANYYYYNQMNEAEQALYDNLDAMAYKYLQSTQNIQGAGENYSEWVSYAGLTLEEAYGVFLLFRYANPQYYFLSGGIGYSRGYGYLTFGIYPGFVGGAARAEATQAFRAKLEEAEAVVETAGDDGEKRAQAAHDWIIDKVSYNDTYTELVNKIQAAETEEEKQKYNEEMWKFELATGYTQSAYSAICMDETVCAGYSQAFEALCNAVGLEAVCATSSDHAWNKIELYGNWYQVDCTWDDVESSAGEEYVVYDYFLRSDEYVMSGDYSAKVHTEDDIYAKYGSQACLWDTISDESSCRSVPGTIADAAKITQKTEAPVCTPSVRLADTTITLSCNTSGSVTYYYTLDGSIPSVSGKRSRRVSGNTITYSGNKTVTVIAKADGYLESSPASYTTVLPNYTVSFVPNNGATLAAQSVQVGDKVKDPATLARVGYTFDGWYTDSTCRNVWDFSSGTVTADMTLYAKWTPVTYQITYAGLGNGKNSKYNPSTYTIETKTITLKNPTRAGYLFKGWYSDSKYTKRVTKIAVGSTGNKKLYAKWTKVTAPKKTSIRTLTNKKGKKLVVTIKKVSGADGYRIRYSTKSTMKSAKTVTTTSLTNTISRLSKGKTYYIQVQAYRKDSTGAKKCSAWSSKKTITIRK